MRPTALLAALLATTALLTGCSDETTAEAPDTLAYHAPPSVPDGLQLCGAFDLPLAGAPEAPPQERMSVWGDAGRADPWSGRVAVVYRRPPDEFWGHEDARPARVRGRRAEVAPMPLFQGVSSEDWGHIATWRRPGGEIIELALRGGSPAATVALANQLGVTDGAVTLPLAALGRRTERLYESPATQEAPRGWQLYYSSVRTTPEEIITISGVPADPDAAHLSALFAVRSEATTVGGVPAVGTISLDATSGPFGLVWTTGGTTISVSGIPGRRARVEAIAESLRPVDGAEWRRVTESAETCVEDPPSGG